MILDTAFVIDLIDGDEGAVEKAAELESADVVVKVPVMTLLELYIGVGKVAHTTQEERNVRRIIGSFPIVEMDHSIATEAGLLIGELAREGIAMKKGDAAIGISARREDEPVLTRNVDDFERIPDLEVETY